ncbi:MAG: hypothetical protein NUV58_02875, partial [Candidatus Roizmanbacteria bacterium]|nr:hypothetical protein [Candidatus Roizmanbacteria bacterium]
MKNLLLKYIGVAFMIFATMPAVPGGTDAKEMKKQESSYMPVMITEIRFDVDFDLPEAYLPEFPPPLYLTSRPDLGDVSGGEEITINNYYEKLNGILTPLQLEGLRLLVTPVAQQQFN